jgi:hypothetical protein
MAVGRPKKYAKRPRFAFSGMRSVLALLFLVCEASSLCFSWYAKRPRFAQRWAARRSKAGRFAYFNLGGE